MKQFLIVRQSDGVVFGTALQDDPDTGPIKPQQPAQEGFGLIPFDGEFSRDGKDGCVATWDGSAVEWSHDMAAVRAHAWAACKAARDAEEAADFMFEGVAYQPDVQKITGAVLAALLPSETPFSIDWTVSDNSVVTLNASQVIGLGLALTSRINAIHHYGRTMRALIDNADTPAEAYGHTWDYQNG